MRGREPCRNPVSSYSMSLQCPRLRKGRGSGRMAPRLRPDASRVEVRVPRSGREIMPGSDTHLVRKVKCDETRPACRKCTSTLRTCDGYSHVQQLPPSSAACQIAALRADLSIDICGCPRSKRSISFFRRRTSPQLAGFFKSEFWGRLVLQTAHREPAVRHAVIALGSLHEASEYRASSMNAARTFALEHYNLAIRELLLPLSQNGAQSVDVCLISCILFTNFEVSAISYTHSPSGCSNDTLHLISPEVPEHERSP
jgi:hypothetical protein